MQGPSSLPYLTLGYLTLLTSGSYQHPPQGTGTTTQIAPLKLSSSVRLPTPPFVAHYSGRSRIGGPESRLLASFHSLTRALLDLAKAAMGTVACDASLSLSLYPHPSEAMQKACQVGIEAERRAGLFCLLVGLTLEPGPVVSAEIEIAFVTRCSLVVEKKEPRDCWRRLPYSDPYIIQAFHRSDCCLSSSVGAA